MTANKGRILVVDDEKDIRFLLNEILTDEGYTIAEAPHSEAAFAEINKSMPDLVILDIWLENSERDGMEILAELKKMEGAPPVLMISGHGNIEMAVKAVKLGAYEFIEKPFNTARLIHLVTRAVESGRLKRGGPASSVRLVAGTPEMQVIQKAAQKAAQGEGRMLFTGPWGAGRAHLARWAHQESGRANQPFVEINCANTDTLHLEKALIQAGTGTLLLKDIQNLAPDVQTFLLSRLNGKLEARVMATSAPDLKTRKFLPDLYERISVSVIALPPLVDRRADIADLAVQFMPEGNTIGEDALTQLKRREWPGQIAELKSVLALANVRMALAGTSEMHPTHIAAESQPNEASDTQKTWLESDLRAARESFERWYFEHLMGKFDGNVSQVAAFAGMDRTALHRKLKSLKDEDDAGERIAS